MYTLSTLESLIDFYLGASNIYSDKTTAANSARRYILMNYDVRDFIKTDTLTFASGIADFPSDYFRAVKMIKTNDSTYQYYSVDEDQFDENLPRHFTIKDDSGTRKIFIQPTSTTSTTLRYIYKPDDLTGTGSEVVGFNDFWLDAHAAFSAWWLLNADRQPIAQEKFIFAQELAQSALVAETRELKATDEISTSFEKINMFDEY